VGRFKNNVLISDIMIVRKATKKDIPSLEKIDSFGNQLNKYSGLDRLDPEYTEEGDRSYYGGFISGKKKWCLLSEESGNILGFILFEVKKRAEYFKIKKVGRIELLFVHKDARKKGVSKLLMEKAREILKKEKIKYLELSVHCDNPARRVWEKHGFKEYRVDMWKRL